MTVLSRYFLKHLTISTLWVTVLLTAALWLTQSLRFVDVVMGKGLSIQDFLKLVILLAPDIMGIVLPFGTLIGVLLVYNRLHMDGELVAMRSSGLSNLRFARPAGVLSIGVCVILYGLHLYFLPLSFQKFKDMEWSIRNNMTGYILQPGEFTTFKNITVYVAERHRTGVLRGIFVYDNRTPENPVTLLAKDGYYRERDDGVRLTLNDGSRQDVDSKTGKPSLLTFAHYTVDLKPSESESPENRMRKPYERFLADLFNAPDAQDNPKLARKLEIEAHQRILTPLTVLGFVLMAVAVFLRGDIHRRGRGRGRRLIWIGVSTLSLEMGMLACLNLSDRFYSMIGAAYLIVLSYPLYALWLLREPGGHPQQGSPIR